MRKKRERPIRSIVHACELEKKIIKIKKKIGNMHIVFMLLWSQYSNLHARSIFIFQNNQKKKKKLIRTEPFPTEH